MRLGSLGMRLGEAGNEAGRAWEWARFHRHHKRKFNFAPVFHSYSDSFV